MTDQPAQGGIASTEALAAGGNNLAKKTVIGAAWLLAWRFLSRTLGIVSTVTLARVLVPEDFGIVAMATTFAAAVEAFSELGLQNALVRHTSHDRRLFDTAFTIQAGRAVITGAFVAAAAPAASAWFNEPRLIPILLTLAALSVVGGMENVGIVEFRRAMRFDVQFKLLLLPRLLGVCTTISLAFLLQNYWALLAGLAVSRVARTAMTYIVHPYRPGLSLTGWRELASFSLWTWALCIPSFIWDRADAFVLGPVIGPAQLGLYLLSLELATLPMTEAVIPISDALFSAFASANRTGINPIVHAPIVAASLVMILLPLIITLSCASSYVVGALLGPKWAAAKDLIAILSWLCLFSPLSYVFSVVLIATGHLKRNFIGRVAVAAAKVVVLLLAVSATARLEVIAAVLAVTFVLECCAYVFLIKGIGSVRIGPMMLALARALGAGALVVLLLHSLGLAWQDVSAVGVDAFLRGALFGGCVAVLYGLLLSALWMLVGRPDGPETRLFEIVEHRVQVALRRLFRPKQDASL